MDAELRERPDLIASGPKMKGEKLPEPLVDTAEIIDVRASDTSKKTKYAPKFACVTKPDLNKERHTAE